MNHLGKISQFEARQMLRLANRLFAPLDPISRKQELLRGLCELVKASGGSCNVVYLMGRKTEATVSATEFHLDGSALAGTLLDRRPGAWCADGRARIHALESKLLLADSTIRATLCLYRLAPPARRFPVRFKKIVDMFHDEMRWVYQPDVLLTSPNAMTLSPRTRQTLEHLLAGLGEKQIALKLNLSPNTVHHYVKSIHRHFGVSSRSELLARWVGNGALADF